MAAGTSRAGSSPRGPRCCPPWHPPQPGPAIAAAGNTRASLRRSAPPKLSQLSGPDQWRIQPFKSARSWAIHQGEENGTVGAMIGEQQTMARSGNLAEWQGRQAAQHQEDERLARERRRQEQEQEKVRQQEHLESQQQAADEQTTQVLEQIKSLDEVLTSVLAFPPMSFDRLMATARTPPFDPGPLDVARPAPDWNDFAPAEPDGWRRLLHRFLARTPRNRRQMPQAQGRFEAAAAKYRQQESERSQALAVATAKYHQKITEERGRAAARNAYVARRQAAFAAGDAESVVWFVRCALKASRYPDDFPRQYQVAYDPEYRNVAVEFELPARRVVPPVRAYRYLQAH